MIPVGGRPRPIRTRGVADRNTKTIHFRRSAEGEIWFSTANGVGAVCGDGRVGQGLSARRPFFGVEEFACPLKHSEAIA